MRGNQLRRDNVRRVRALCRGGRKGHKIVGNEAKTLVKTLTHIGHFTSALVRECVFECVDVHMRWAHVWLCVCVKPPVVRSARPN